MLRFRPSALASAGRVPLRCAMRVPSVSTAGSTRRIASQAREQMEAARGALASARAFAPQIIAAGGALVVIYGVSSIAMHITTTFLNLDFKTVYMTGLATGVLTTAALGFGGWRGFRAMRLRPGRVYRAALDIVQKDPRATAALGANVKPGPLLAYRQEAAHVSATKMGWVEPRVGMLFQVVGADTGREGMVTVEAVKVKGALKLNVVALDVLPKPASMPRGAIPGANAHAVEQPHLIILAGKEEKLHVKGALRGFLQAERVQFLAQDRLEQDEDKLREQAAVEKEVEALPPEQRASMKAD